MHIQIPLLEENYIDLMFEHMPAGIALFDAQDLRLLAANALFQSFLHPSWQHGQALGHPLPEWLEAPHASNIVAIFRRVAESGIPFRREEYLIPSPERGITYWNMTVGPIRDEHGHIVKLLHTACEVTDQVLQRQAAECAHATLSLKTQEVKTERKHLAVVETVARGVRDYLNIHDIARAATETIFTSFHPLSVGIHCADPVQRRLNLLAMCKAGGNEQARTLLQHVPYDSPLLMVQTRNQHEPIIIEDIQNTSVAAILEHEYSSFNDARGLISIPLWFKDRFEGALTASFTRPISANSAEVRTLLDCGTHIAVALAHGHLHAEVEKERTRLRSILDQLPEGIMLVDYSDNYISYVNAAAVRILGVPAEQQIHIPPAQHPEASQVTDLQGHPISPNEFPSALAISGKATDRQEVIVTRPDGSKVVIRSSVVPLRTTDDRITGAVVVFQDITAWKSAEQQKNAFLSLASHELRTPITAIQGIAEILQMYVQQGHNLDTARSTQAIAGIAEQSQHLKRLIEEMLDISRIENAHLILQRTSCDLLSILQQVIDAQSISNQHHHLSLILEGFQPGKPLIGEVDESRVVQAINNLVSNAIKYSPGGGEIEIGLVQYPETDQKNEKKLGRLPPLITPSGASHSSRMDPQRSSGFALGCPAEQPGEVHIWVKDQGVGIPPAELSHIFERFHRASNLDRSISGLGIGLYLVKELVTRHGGRVWAESAEGKGSTFHIVLPLHQGTP